MVKILIVDDTPQRYQSVFSQLEGVGVPRSAIKVITSSNEALDELKSVKYDLLILDILIPAWPELEPDQQNSLDLLFTVMNDPEVIKPSSIVGITSDQSAADEALPFFEENTWTIVTYSPVSDGWVSKITNCVTYLKNKATNAEPVYHDFDLVILCALSSPEMEEIICLPWEWSAAKPMDDTSFFREGKLQIGSKIYKVAAASATRMGMVSSAVLATKAIQIFRPRVLAMTGICAAHKSKAKLGDVLVVDPAWDFQSGKMVSVDGTAKMEFSPHQIPLSAFLRSRFEQLSNEPYLSADITNKFGSGAPSGFKLRIGPVASGGAVLADGKIIDDIRHLQNRDLLGIEMEVYGVYAAAQQSSSPQPKFFAIKSVCDYADPEKQDGAQKFAAFASANVLQKFVEKFCADLFS